MTSDIVSPREAARRLAFSQTLSGTRTLRCGVLGWFGTLIIQPLSVGQTLTIRCHTPYLKVSHTYPSGLSVTGDTHITSTPDGPQTSVLTSRLETEQEQNQQ